MRKPYYELAIIFLACGMVTLMFYAWARAEKLRRREISARNRELRHREREEELRREREKILARKAAAAVYRQLYACYRTLHDAFGTDECPGQLNQVMKELIAIRQKTRQG